MFILQSVTRLGRKRLCGKAQQILSAASRSASAPQMAVLLPPDPVFSLRSADMGAVHSVTFDSCQRLCAGTASGRIFLWDLQTNRCRMNFSAAPRPIIALHRDARGALVSQEKGAGVKVWRPTNCGYEVSGQIETDSGNFCRIDCSDERDLMLVPKGANHLQVHSLRDLQLVMTLQPEAEESLGALMSCRIIDPDAAHALAAFESGHFVTWDLREGKVLSSVKLEESPMALDYDSLTNRGICAGPGDSMRVFAFQRPQMAIVQRSEIALKNPGISVVRIRPDRKVFVSGGWDGRVRVFSWKSLRPLAVLTEHKKGVLDVAFSPGSVDLWRAPLMAVAGEDSQISLWNLYN
ncbi:guanine nucleotide-binding protein subunit beta-like protein 1 isoform X2 [Phlebotomus argentipes]|uniref:guanine nucleotide-binding protein subunit beta-like protein 1 isoform X2 n=1 Tax=Phlebotomus argentipes TaxID=94469 RepID=UPI002892CD52|nr:guanine nucleotide-binding protein subunit beta-like protein 1 isoform X2 [Phlebotomus argentipes]